MFEQEPSLNLKSWPDWLQCTALSSLMDFPKSGISFHHVNCTGAEERLG